MKWIKDNGDEIETNDLPATIAHCESIGWERDESDEGSDEITDADINNVAKAAYNATRKASEEDMPAWGKAGKEAKESIMAIVKAVMDDPDYESEGDEVAITTALKELETLVG